MKALLTPLVLAFVLTASVGAQDAPARATQAFGIASGYVTGTGLSYRYWPGDLGLQVTGIAVLAGSLEFSLGVTGLFSFAETKETRFYGYFGGEVSSFNLNAGAGYGIELILVDHITLDLQAGLRAGLQVGGWVVGPSIEGGIYYRL